MSNSPPAKLHSAYLGVRHTVAIGLWLGPESTATCVLSLCPVCRAEIVVEPSHVTVSRWDQRVRIQTTSAPAGVDPLHYEPEVTICSERIAIEHRGFAACPSCRSVLKLIIRGRIFEAWDLGTGVIHRIDHWDEDTGQGGAS